MTGAIRCLECGRKPKWEKWTLDDSKSPYHKKEIVLYALVCKDARHICWGDYRNTRAGAIVAWNIERGRDDYQPFNKKGVQKMEIAGINVGGKTIAGIIIAVVGYGFMSVGPMFIPLIPWEPICKFIIAIGLGWAGIGARIAIAKVEVAKKIGS